jgi:hypothetical protein
VIRNPSPGGGTIGERQKNRGASGPVGFTAITALEAFPAVLARISGIGEHVEEMVARAGDKDADPFSFYVADVSQYPGARRVAQMLGGDAGGPSHG